MDTIGCWLISGQRGIEKEIERVRQKQNRSTLGRLADATEDADEVLECYRRIQVLLGRLAVSGILAYTGVILKAPKLNSNLSVWKIVDDQSTVSGS